MKVFLTHILGCCLLIFPYSEIIAQYFGGNGDGYLLAETDLLTINNQDFYCLGGIADGQVMELSSSTINLQGDYCAGGSSSGYDMASSGSVVQFDQSLYCNGGIEDGYEMQNTDLATLNNQITYCLGGNGDGYHLSSSGLLIQNEQNLYCNGGVGDGYSKIAFSNSINNQVFYCDGGFADGSTLISSGVLTANDASFYCSGGIGDGHDCDKILATVNLQGFYCYGGINEGYNLTGLNTSINAQSFYCTGGNSDGYIAYNFVGNIFGTNLYCLGGDGDGYMLAGSSNLNLGIGIWRGITSTNWNTNSNWSHNTIPAYDDEIHIPVGCTFYPNISGSLGINSFGETRCHSIFVESGANLNHSGYLFIRGEMRVEGSYINTFNIARSQIIFTNGLLHIPQSGIVKMGNQTTGTGLVDLLVNNEGTLFIQGGTLEIDDQLHVGTGGTFNMTGGELFIHKHGAGSPLSLDNPYNFWVKVGAMGELSGGTVRITGRDTDGIFGAVSINDPDFLFNGSNTLVFQHGDNPTHFDPAIYFPNGGSLQNLTINKPGNTVSVKSDLTVKGALNIESGSTLKVENGHQLTIGQ